MEIIFQKRFNSIEELAAEAGQRKQLKRIENESLQRKSSFFGDQSYDDAVAMAAAGGYWKEGTENMLEAARAVIPDGAARPLPKYRSAFAGSRVSVPRYLASAPRHMVRRDSVPSDRRVIRIGVAVGRSMDVEQAEAVNRGAAILSAIKQIESSGNTVELWACWRNMANGQAVSIETLVKPAGAFFSPADCAFALCHVGFQRRLCWGVAEIHEEHTAPVLESGYGRAGASWDDFDAHIPYMVSGYQWWEPASALEYIQGILAGQLEAAKTAAA